MGLAPPAPAPPARTDASATRQAVLLVNRAARRVRSRDVARAASLLGERFRIAVREPTPDEPIERIARDAAADGAEVVVVLGGDGTCARVAAGLVGTPTSMACLPGGCTNVFARALGTPRSLDAALTRLAGGALVERRVDVGLVNGRPFLCTSGIGLSASMTAAVDAAPRRKARFGQLHFAVTAAGELLTRYRRDPPRLRVECAGGAVEGVTAVVQNARALTFIGSREVRACSAADLRSGTLSAAVLRAVRPRDVPPVLARLLSRAGSVTEHRAVRGLTDQQHVAVVSADGRALPVEADGEYLGEHLRVDYLVAPQALRVLA